MDLIIETKQYKYTYDHLEMSYIHNFISNKIGMCAKTCKKYYLTKKEMQELLNYLKQLKFSFDAQKERLIEQLSNMEMLMITGDTASFYFW